MMNPGASIVPHNEQKSAAAEAVESGGETGMLGAMIRGLEYSRVFKWRDSTRRGDTALNEAPLSINAEAAWSAM
ncbi:hypothetical protein PC129_g22161 [Phytophthora cactorum]|uniref:Uncharacterized protein n=1 Tax=Phytophthora cactorum TaxID=29920 RepID=A0A8T1CI41_9STRA|nr:hypothetical protein Pcac1_g24557 [Phytophthora cactorum]KAG2813490.1 hypothetical protein PC112_g14709 [Phytophthora cactorum]KAG2874528.1 hypothetical protein PC115_g24127 [Phytophthora cactorum]KAG2893777.1 hypothetical protein PC114_g16142 [Phytophthora cactorum]KAG2923897.1 hypothetical protein PC117_g15559 [Phytophthora cactorum]